jgi:NAD(P)-dependent dehydrogenase (short-subunit alcohol dehydrogenase family)
MQANKVVVITGGAGVLGSCFVQRIAEHGGIAVAADIDTFSAELSTTKSHDYGAGRIEKVNLDITDLSSICRLIDDLLSRHGRIDAVVNNAYPRSPNYGRSLEDVEYSDFCESIDRHLGGYFLVSQQFCRVFKRQGGGVVVNMSSIYGSMAPRFDIYDGTEMTMPVEYAAIKSGIEQLTRYFAQYYKKSGIRVNSISPGGILADQPSVFLSKYNQHCGANGMLSPDDVVGALLLLLSDEGKFITGQNLIVDDGFSL